VVGAAHVRRGREPLLNPRLAHTQGYAVGTGIGLIYFIGFTGVWLVLALFLQDGLGYSPLRSGLTVTPFALGVAVSAVVAGRFVARAGRWLTVGGLVAVVAGLLVTASVLRHTSPDAVQLAIAGPLLVAGLGGGLVTSPNMTLTLQNVPVVMAGVAGGAVQTAQRIGASIGTAALATIFYHVLLTSGGDYTVAVSDAVLSAAAFAVAALALAAGELAHRRHRGTTPGRPEGSAADESIAHAEHQLHHL
jgi:MFS family permease